MKSTNAAYSFACAYLKGEEARTVSSEQVEGLLQRTSSIRESLEIIKDTDLGEYLWDRPINKVSDIDLVLWEYLHECGERLKRFRLPRDMELLLKLYLQKYDVLNVKIALRKVISKETPQPAPIGDIYDMGNLDELMIAETIRDISEVLVKSDLVDYIDVLDSIKDVDRRSLIEGETRLDGRYYNKMQKSMSGMIDGGIMNIAVTTVIDLTNMAVLFRKALEKQPEFFGDFFLDGGQVFDEATLRELSAMKHQEIVSRLEETDYDLLAQDIVKLFDKTGTADAVDRVMDRYKYRLLQDLLSPRVLSPCNLYWYFMVKELEIRNLRLTLKASFDGLEPSETREYLVAI